MLPEESSQALEDVAREQKIHNLKTSSQSKDRSTCRRRSRKIRAARSGKTRAISTNAFSRQPIG